MPKKQPTEAGKERLRDTPFNPDRCAASDKTKQWIKSALKAIEAFEIKKGLRQRKRKPVDQKLFEEQIEALLCDLVFTLLYQPKDRTGKISVSLSKQKVGPKQGGHRLVNSTLGRTLQLLGHDGLGLIEVTKGSKKSGLQTTVGVTKKLQAQIRGIKLQTDDLTLRKERPLIELRGPKVAGKRGKSLPLPQDPEVSLMTRELEEINEFLSQAQIEYHGSKPNIDERDRRISRVFNLTLKSYGQPQGGFWKQLKCEDRLGNLYIEDEPIIELDLKSACLQIAYALKGLEPLEDFYKVPSLQMLKREEIKKTTLTYINGGRAAFKHGISKTIYKKMCPGMEEDDDKVLSHLLSAIKDHHKPIAEYFNPDGSAYLAYIQGEVILDAVIRLMKQKIIALPVGDAIDVKESAEDQAIRAFQKSFEEKTGSKNKITLSS